MPTFYQKLADSINQKKSLICVGLDSDYGQLPESIKSQRLPQFSFNQNIVDATADLVMSYKLNTAFYEARGENGIAELKMTCDYLRQKYPTIVIILDAKRADIGHTNAGYVQFAFDYLQADAITLHPYLGQEALRPFLDQKDKGCIILCRTSNPGASEIQDLPTAKKDTPLYLVVAQKVTQVWNQNQNCALVVGATYPQELRAIRKIAPELPILIPGIGAQGGELGKTLTAGLDRNQSGVIISLSRSVIFADASPNFAQSARTEVAKLNHQINQIMKEPL